MTDLERLKGMLPDGRIEQDQEKLAAHLIDWQRKYSGRALAMARPASTQEVALILRWASETRTPIVPQGGNTGLAGGSIPDQSAGALLLSLERMKNIRWISREDNALIAEAGCTLLEVQEVASGINRLFPLSLSAEGTCQIGGNLATNAGGVNVLRYGMARDLVLGLEVVLADGTILSSLTPLRKNNSGYDWKHLFIGSEGTLGIITAACLELFPAIKERATALLALRRLEDAPSLLHCCQEVLEQRISSFELLPQFGLELGGAPSPFPQIHSWYILLEAGGQQSLPMERCLEEAFKKGLISDAILAQSGAQSHRLWQLREKMVEAQRQASIVIRHDIALPIATIPSFIFKATTMAHDFNPHLRPLVFGHLGDGNLHFNILAEQTEPVLSRQLHDLVMEMGGTFSAEHGIGQARLEDMARYKPLEELALMRRLKQSLDPMNILNPGKVLPASKA